MKRSMTFLIIFILFISVSCEKKEMKDDNSPPANLKLGDNYGGGIIFHLNPDGGGLVFAPSDASTKAVWGCRVKKMSTSDDIGTGESNTKIILTNCKDNWIAAKLADDFSLNGFSDWYLPSLDELQKMNTIHLVELKEKGGGNFAKDEYYWSSSQTAFDEMAHAVPFGLDYTKKAMDKKTELRVRPIRSF